MAAMRWSFYDDDDPDTIANNDVREIISNNYDLLFSAESCRRLVATSCRGREGYVPVSTLPLMQGDFRGQMGRALVIMAGYDDVDIDAGIDAIVDEATAQGVERIIWLTYHSSTTYKLPDGTSAAALYEQHNASLVAAAARHPNLELLDWNGYASPHPEWFASDRVHLSVAGAVALVAVHRGPPRCGGRVRTVQRCSGTQRDPVDTDRHAGGFCCGRQRLHAAHPGARARHA